MKWKYAVDQLNFPKAQDHIFCMDLSTKAFCLIPIGEVRHKCLNVHNCFVCEGFVRESEGVFFEGI